LSKAVTCIPPKYESSDARLSSRRNIPSSSHISGNVSIFALISNQSVLTAVGGGASAEPSDDRGDTGLPIGDTGLDATGLDDATGVDDATGLDDANCDNREKASSALADPVRFQRDLAAAVTGAADLASAVLAPVPVPVPTPAPAVLVALGNTLGLVVRFPVFLPADADAVAATVVAGAVAGAAVVAVLDVSSVTAT
jgi:hypothetical protein